MATDFKSIPLIDVSPLVNRWDDPNMAQDDGVAEVVRKLGRACREAGFFYVEGHGIPESLVKEVRSISRQFFHSPYEEKLKIKLSEEAGYRGYQRVGENITKGVPDMHEAIDCYREVKPGMYGALGEVMEGVNRWPSDPPQFRKSMEEYVNRCTDLSKKILRGIALALGLPAKAFEGNIAGDPFWVLRVIGYPVLHHSNGEKMPDNDVGCGAHTDYGLLTLVNQDDDITALQVRNSKGEWISAIPIPGTFVCNIGDMLKPWMSQLAAVACVSIAAKMEETQVPLLLDFQIEESKYLFEAKTIQRMELLVLSTLQWKLNLATPISFIDHMSRRFELVTTLHWEFSSKCDDLILSIIADCRLVKYLPSVIAAATMVHVIRETRACDSTSYMNQIMSVLMASNKSEVDECCKLIEEVRDYNSSHGKRRNGSTPSSRSGVIDAYLSSDSSIDSSPEPLFKRSRVQEHYEI